MRPVAYALDSVLCTQRFVSGLIIGHDVTAIAIKQARQHILRLVDE